LEYVIGRNAFRTDITGKESLRRSKHSMIEIVELKEEEEEEEEEEEDTTEHGLFLLAKICFS
jgi:CO dehydrogenase/acetyl-CoA synthase beta subunit